MLTIITLYLISRKQKLNTRSSTKAELVGADHTATMICWMKMFIEEEGFEVKLNVIYQDNRSKISLMRNVKASLGKCTQLFDLGVCGFQIWKQVFRIQKAFFISHFFIMQFFDLDSRN